MGDLIQVLYSHQLQGVWNGREGDEEETKKNIEKWESRKEVEEDKRDDKIG